VLSNPLPFSVIVWPGFAEATPAFAAVPLLAVELILVSRVPPACSRSSVSV